MAAPATCILTGTVENPPGTPVEGARVRVRTIALQLLSNGAGSAVNDLETVTDALGAWQLTLARGLAAQIDVAELDLYKDIRIPDLTTVDLSALTLYNRGTLTPATIISEVGPSMGGDLTGSSPNPIVIGIRGIPVLPFTPADGLTPRYRTASGGFVMEALPVEAAVQAVAAGQGIEVTGPAEYPVVAIAIGGVIGTMLAAGVAAANVGSLSGDLTGALPTVSIASGAVTDVKVAAGASIAWSKLNKVGAVAGDVGAVADGAVLAAVNASLESPKIASAQLQDIPEAKVTGLVADLAAKRNTADAIAQADVTGLVAALAAKELAANKGVANGYAGLDGSGKVPTAQLPATVVADGDKGDISVTIGVWTVDPKAIAYSKIQDVSAPDRILGVITAGTLIEIPFTAQARSLAACTDFATMRTTLELGTAATRNVPAAGDAAAAEVVKGDDTRLTNARTPTAHVHAEADVTGLVSDLAGKVPATRRLSGAGPVTVGGAASADLSADREIAVAAATAGALGIVQLAGDLAGTGAAPVVASVGGKTAADVASAVTAVGAATAAKVGATIVLRDISGSAALDVVGNVTGNVSGSAASITGVNPIANGGTGQPTALAAFDGLSPTSAKGDLIGHDGTVSVRVAVGADGTVPIADSTQLVGWRWGTISVGLGTVTSVGTGSGLQGGPITGAGTVDLRLNAAGGLSKTLGAGNELGVAPGGVDAGMLAAGVAAANIGALSGVLTGSLPNPGLANDVVTDSKIAAGAGIAWSKVSKVGAFPADVGAFAASAVLAAINASAESPKIANAQLQDLAESKVTGLVADLAAKRNAADPIPQADVTGLVAALAGKADLAGDTFSGPVTFEAAVTAASLAVTGVSEGQLRDKGGQIFNVLAYGVSTANAPETNRLAIQALIDALPASGGILYFPEGVYNFNGPIYVRYGTQIWGAGQEATQLVNYANADGFRGVYDGANAYTNPQQLVFKDFYLRNGYADRTTGDGIHIENPTLTAQLTIERVHLFYHYRGFYGYGVILSKFVMTRAAHNKSHGFYFTGATTSVHADQCFAANNIGDGYFFDAAARYCVLTACASDANAGNGYHIKDSYAISLVSPGCEANVSPSSAYGIYVEGSDGISIISPLLQAGGDGIRFSGSTKSSVRSGRYVSNTGYGIAVVSASTGIAIEEPNVITPSLGSFYIDGTSKATITNGGKTGYNDPAPSMPVTITESNSGGIVDAFLLRNAAASAGWSGAAQYFGYSGTEVATGGLARVVGYAKRGTNYGSALQLQTHGAGASASYNVGIYINEAGQVGVNTTTQAGAMAINGGVHVGGDSDPGDNNLLVDGTIGGQAITGTWFANAATATTLANGLNSNITGAGYARVTGPTGAFSVGGFTAGIDGRVLRIYNTVSQTMTIVNEDTSSTAANRITTLTGANVALRATAPSMATFIYDATASRWILVSYN